MDLAEFIEQARGKKDLSFRELEKLAGDLDHAYIWRLAKGARDTPSPATVQKLSGALQLDEREQQIFQLLVEMSIDDALYQLMLNRRDIPWSDFEPVATMSFRGDRRNSEEGWLKLIEMVRDL